MKSMHPEDEETSVLFDNNPSQPQEQHPPRNPLDTNVVPLIKIRGRIIGPGYVFSHGKRMTPPQRQLAVEYLSLRDGSSCNICQQHFDDPSGCDIDHVDGDKYNHTASNLRLLCHSDNARIGWAQKQLHHGSSSSVHVGVSQGRGVGVGDPRSDADLRALSRQNESEFRRFYFQHILEVEGKMRSAEKSGSPIAEPNDLMSQLHPNVIRAMAREEVGISRASAFSYEERLLAPNGPLEVKRDEYVGVALPYVGFRDNRCNSMAVEEIDAIHPVEGQLYRRSQGVK